MKLPTTPESLPPHRCWDIPAADRTALADLVWTQPMLPGHEHHFSLGQEGVFVIAPPSLESRVVRLSYQLPLEPGRTLKDVWEEREALGDERVRTVRSWELGALSSPQEIGYATDAVAAKELWNLARRLPPGVSASSRLAASGMTRETREPGNGGEIWTKPDGHRGTYTLFVSPTGVRLIHEKRHQNRWTNLFSLEWAAPTYDQTAYIPRFLPPSVACPAAAACAMAARMTELWVPDYRPRRRLR